MRSLFLTGATLLLAAPMTTAAQGMPPGWRAITDTPAEYVAAGIEPNAEARYNFVSMAPGWHITTGPGTLLFDPQGPASGNFRLETELFLFPNPSDQPVGLFVGGMGLDGPLAGVQWFGVLVRRDGTAAVIHNHGTDHHPVTPYLRLDSLPPHPIATSQRIILAVDVQPDSVRFSVNRSPVGALPRGDLRLDGPFGFRVGRGQNLHVVRLDYTHRLAPMPEARR
ncbi:MAG: hypothetical protein ABR551_08090 [Gemmatimonadales bacterium]